MKQQVRGIQQKCFAMALLKINLSPYGENFVRAIDLGRLMGDQVISVSCLNFKQENLRGDYHGYVCKDTADVLP
jgi:hypothetical protein